MVESSTCTDFKLDIVEYTGNNFLFLQVVIVSEKVYNRLTGKDYTKEFLTFIRNEQRRSNIMTSDRIQPFRRKYKINIGFYDGFRVCARNNTKKIKH